MLPTHFSKLVSLLCGAEVISLSFSFQKHFLCFIISAAFLKILLEPYLIKMWNQMQYSNTILKLQTTVLLRPFQLGTGRNTPDT